MASKQHRQDVVELARRTIRSLKVTAGCCDCGYRDNPCALQFDHRDPASKRVELGWRRDASKLTTHARLRAFLDHVARYCDVRCANCHAVRSFTEQHHLLPHGSRFDRPAPTLF